VVVPLVGADAVTAWFGRWPSFHDAEILTVHIERGGTSYLRIRTWNVGHETDADGFYVRSRETVVVFEFTDIADIRLEGEDADRQNVIAGLALQQENSGLRLILSPCYGIAGYIVAREISVRLETPERP
jgi:hypothetical protein